MKKANRQNLGVCFNLCHFLILEDGKDLERRLTAAAPHLLSVNINGADGGDTTKMGWKRLIQTLDRGSFDVGRVLRTLERLALRRPGRATVLRHPRRPPRQPHPLDGRLAEAQRGNRSVWCGLDRHSPGQFQVDRRPTNAVAVCRRGDLPRGRMPAMVAGTSLLSQTFPRRWCHALANDAFRFGVVGPARASPRCSSVVRASRTIRPAEIKANRQAACRSRSRRLNEAVKATAQQKELAEVTAAGGPTQGRIGQVRGGVGQGGRRPGGGQGGIGQGEGTVGRDRGRSGNLTGRSWPGCERRSRC